SEPRIFCAPGRVNIVGEHTDYNDGFVMPAAIGLSTRVAAQAVPGRHITIQSETMAQSVSMDLDEHDPEPRHDWTDYVLGVVLMLRSAGLALRGARLLIHGNIPIGSGLSSSASLEVATAFALLEIAGIQISRSEIARLCNAP